MSEIIYAMQLRFDGTGGEWQIYRYAKGDYKAQLASTDVVWRRSYKGDEDCGAYSWPDDMRAEYERLTGKPEFDMDWYGIFTPQIVELADDDEGSGFNQVCKFGYLVADHSVYCHNEGWLYSPRKCRRTWYTGGETKDEDCPGFQPRMIQ